MSIRTQTQLIEAAKANGLSVTDHGTHVVIVRDGAHGVTAWPEDRTTYDNAHPAWAPRRLNIKSAAALLQLA